MIIIDKRIPEKPVATGDMTEEEIRALIQEGYDSISEGTYTLEEVDEYFEKKYGFKRNK